LTGEKGGSKRSRAKRDNPIAPVELDLAEVGIEELIKENLNAADAKLGVLDEQRMGLVLEDFVDKDNKDAFDGFVDKSTTAQHKILVKRGTDNKNDVEGNENKIVTSAAVREICNAQSEKKKQDAEQKVESEPAGAKRAKPAKVHVLDDDDEEEDGDEKKEASSSVRNKASSAKPTQQAATKQGPAKSTSRPTREAAKAASSKLAYNLSDDDDIDLSDDNYRKHDGSDEEVKAVTKTKAKSRASTAATARTTSVKRKSASEPVKATRGKAIPKLYDDDDSDMDDDVQFVGVSSGKGWGTANSQSQVNKRERR